MEEEKQTSVDDSRKRKVASPSEILPEEVKKPASSISVGKEEEARSQMSMKEPLGSTTTEANNQEPSNLDKVPEEEILISQDHAKFAIDHYNNDKKENWKFVELVRVNIEYVSGIMYYLTFRAQDEDSAVHDFQAKVWERIKKANEVKMCRKKDPSTCKFDKVFVRGIVQS